MNRCVHRIALTRPLRGAGYAVVIVAATRHGHIWLMLQVCYPPCVERGEFRHRLARPQEGDRGIRLWRPQRTLIYLTQEDGEKYGIAFTRMNIPGYDGNASAAYRTAYDAPNTSDDAVRIEAYRLRKNPHIALAIERFHQSKAVETMLTLEAHMHDTAMASGKLGAAVRAEFLRGRAMGFYSDKTEHVATNEFARVTNLIDEQTKALDLVPAPKVSTKLRLKH